MAPTRRSAVNWDTQHNIELVNRCKAYRKMVLPIAISTILYNRVEVDENDFETGCFGGVSYKMLRLVSENPYVSQVNNMIYGALDAMERDYICNMFVIIESLADPTKADCYNFEYDHLGNGQVPMPDTVWSPEQTVTELLRSLPSLDRIYNMDVGVAYSIHLRCYEIVTPWDYLPPYYHKTTEIESYVNPTS